MDVQKNLFFHLEPILQQRIIIDISFERKHNSCLMLSFSLLLLEIH